MKFLATFFSLAIFGLAQGQTTDFGKIDVSFTIGFRATSATQLTLADYQEMLPDSPVLNSDLSMFSQSSGYQSNSGPAFGVLWGIRTKTNNNIEQRLRVGFQYSSFTSHSLGLYYGTTNPYDTLTSSQTGQQTFIDSTYSNNVYVQNTQDVFTLDVSYIIRSNPNGRLSVFAGIGIEAGALLNAQARVNQLEDSYISESDGYGYHNRNYRSYYDGYNGSDEVYRLDPGFIGNLYMPIGVDFRFGKVSEFWKRMHVYTELRPGIQYASFNELQDEFQLNFGMAVVGVRHQF